MASFESAPAVSSEVRTLIIFGADGDLTSRLLLPGLGRLLGSGAGRRLRLVGVGMTDWDDDAWREVVSTSFETVAADGDAVDRIRAETTFHQVDVTDADAVGRLFGECEGPFAIFFALPPRVTAKACAVLGEVRLPAATRLVLEKPFGIDAASARELNRTVTSLVPESHVHRVDHFLGKSTVLNILGLRFANRLFEPLWSNEHVATVDIVFDEDLGLEGRAGYYDKNGALRDMVQSHLLQVLALLAMEPPPRLDERELRDRMADVLRATRVAGEPSSASRRARWTAGRIDGRELPAYADEEGVDPARGTETLAEVDLRVDNWRWAGVPFRLRSGKGLGSQRKEIVVTFGWVPMLPAGLSGSRAPARLRIGLGPDRLMVELDVNGPGNPMELEHAQLSADLAEAGLPAYGEVLDGVLRGDPMLSVRGDVAEQCWRIVEPVLDAWAKDEVPLEEYPAGSDGPSSWGLLGDAYAEAGPPA